MAQVRPTRFADAARRPPQDDSCADGWPTQFANRYRNTCHSERSEESPVFSIGRGAQAFTSPFARTLRQPDGCLRMTVSAQV